MFDRSRLEHFLDSLQTETHFPSGVLKKIIVDMASRSHLNDLMDKYDILKLLSEEYENIATPEFPVLAKKVVDFGAMYQPIQWPSSAFPMQWSTYAGLSSVPYSVSYVTGIDVSDDLTERAFDRLKLKLKKLATVESAEIADPAPPAPSRFPDFVHALTAWRGWLACDGVLESLGTDSEWEPRRAPKARCHQKSMVHTAPSMICACGYWSFKTKELLVQAMKSYVNEVNVIGQVEIWGRVIECKNGFRSEYAYPKELWLLDEGLESLSWKYGVPVRKL